MTYEEIQARTLSKKCAGRAKGKIVELGENDKVEADDYVEWVFRTWTTVDAGSPFIGKPPPKGVRFVRIE